MTMDKMPKSANDNAVSNAVSNAARNADRPDVRRRRFIGQVGRVAPAAVLTFSSGAAIAQAHSSALTASVADVSYTPVDPMDDPNADAINAQRARQAAADEGVFVDDKGDPVCVDAPSLTPSKPVIRDDRLDLSGLSPSDLTSVDGAYDATARRCTNGGSLVSASSLTSFINRTVA